MKKVLLPVMALLVLFAVAPVMAAPATKTPFTADVSFVLGNVYAGEEWITMDGIYHVKGQVSQGPVTLTPVTGDILVGTMLIVRHATLDLNTGDGSCHGKIVITVNGGTFEGSEQSTITLWGAHISGTFLAQGTGMYEGQTIMASFEGGVVIVDGVKTVVAEFEGIILSPKG